MALHVLRVLHATFRAKRPRPCCADLRFREVRSVAEKTGFPESLSNLLGAGNGDDEEREL